MDIPREDYLKKIEQRGKESRCYQAHQLIGLEIADILDDRKHKALYIKLAKTHNTQLLRGLAKDIAENERVNNKGAYFMTRLKSTINS